LQTLVDRGPRGPLRNLYVHVPYCRDRCTYCAFTTVFDRPGEHDSLVTALLAEWQRHQTAGPWDTVYLGGGTPSLLTPATLATLLNGIRRQTPIAQDAEVTLEVNPLNVDTDALAAWSDLGITRLSLGVQTFESETLRQLARHHDGDDARRALGLIAASWTGSWSADLLVGWRDQTTDHVQSDTNQLLQFGPPHLSVYGLTIEPGTPLHALQDQGHRVTADPELSLDYDTLWSEQIVRAGLDRYEVSNFALPGHASRHNSAYWLNQDYLGLGPGASSSLGTLRWSNTPDVSQYLEATASGQSVRHRVERLQPMARLIECLAVGLRTKQGLSLADLDRRFSPAWREGTLGALQALQEGGFVSITKTHIKLHSNNIVLADNITLQLVSFLNQTDEALDSCWGSC